MRDALEIDPHPFEGLQIRLVARQLVQLKVGQGHRLPGAATLQVGLPTTGVIGRLLANLRPPSGFDHVALLAVLLVALTLHIRGVPALRIFFLLSEIVV